MQKTFIILSLLICLTCQGQITDSSLEKYKRQLDGFRKEFGGVHVMPDVKFFLFGMGNRRKMIYKNGFLQDAITKKILKQWDIKSQLIIPNAYRVIITLKNNKTVVIEENEKGVFLREGEKNVLLSGTSSFIKLPSFEGQQYSEILKELNHEILINIVEGKPLPNLFVYHNPWRRDAAMMAMCLEKTGNLNLIRNWVLTLSDPYDYNNAGEAEADNLGQTLYLLSFFTDKSNPLVQKILYEAKKIEVKSVEGTYINGRSDFHNAPVYQTKWLKFGLSKLDLPDPYIIPSLQDNYSSLFWWDYKDSYMKGTIDAYDEWKNDNYPYIGWAADHFHGLKRNSISNQDYPLTWEIEASQANYLYMKIIDTVFVKTKCSVPHTWHASEVFLYLIDN